MPTNHGAPLGPLAMREILDLDIWVLADAEQRPLVVQESESGAVFGIGFTREKAAIAADLGQELLLHTTVWSVLRASPRGIGLIIEPGQDDEVVIPDSEIDGVLAHERETASMVSKKQRTVIANATVVVSGERTPDGALVAQLDDDADELPSKPTWWKMPALLASTTDEISVRSRNREVARIDAQLRTELIEATSIFPHGFDITVGTLATDVYASYLAAATRLEASLREDTGLDVGVVAIGQRVEDALERVLYVLIGADDRLEAPATDLVNLELAGAGLPGVSAVAVTIEHTPDYVRSLVVAHES